MCGKEETSEGLWAWPGFLSSPFATYCIGAKDMIKHTVDSLVACQRTQQQGVLIGELSFLQSYKKKEKRCADLTMSRLLLSWENSASITIFGVRLLCLMALAVSSGFLKNTKRTVRLLVLLRRVFVQSKTSVSFRAWLLIRSRQETQHFPKNHFDVEKTLATKAGRLKAEVITVITLICAHRWSSSYSKPFWLT